MPGRPSLGAGNYVKMVGRDPEFKSAKEGLILFFERF